MSREYTLVHEGLSQWINSPNNGGECCQTYADTVDELNRLLARIKRLEDVVNDPHALWANWLRGDVKLPVGIGDVRQYQYRIKRLEEVLRRIANTDYRGNRSPESQIAEEALKEDKL